MHNFKMRKLKRMVICKRQIWKFLPRKGSISAYRRRSTCIIQEFDLEIVGGDSPGTYSKGRNTFGVKKPSGIDLFFFLIIFVASLTLRLWDLTHFHLTLLNRNDYCCNKNFFLLASETLGLNDFLLMIES